MTALDAARDTEKQVGEPIPQRIGRGAAADILYKGGMAAINAAGYLAPAGVAATDFVVGRFCSTVDNSGGSAGDLNAEAEMGVFRWTNGDSSTDAHAGDRVFAVDDQTVSKDDNGGTRPYAGVIVDVDAAGVWVLQGLFMLGAEADVAALEAKTAAVALFQTAGGTFVSGTATIASGITVTADTDAFVVMSAAITGSTNVGGIAHIKASNVVGAPGVGSVTLNVLGADGAIDTDAAGAFRVLLID
jgi:hypothetical protein